MKKLLLLILTIFLISCKDVKDGINEPPDPFHGSDKIVAIDTLLNKKQTLKTDTLFFENTKGLIGIDKVVALKLKKEFRTDSVEIILNRLDFYRQNKVMHSIVVNTYASSEEANWSLYEDVFADEKSKKSDSRFFEISYGVGACGYTQTNFLFFKENHNFQLIAQYDSMGDGPYGDGLEFEPNFVDGRVVYFSSKRVEINNDESKPYNDDNEDLVRTISDSTAYLFNSGKWLSQLKTAKGKPYRTEFKTFKQLFPQE